jgi:hypothetical protein
MKVKEVIAELQKIDGEKDCLYHHPDIVTVYDLDIEEDEKAVYFYPSEDGFCSVNEDAFKRFEISSETTFDDIRKQQKK